MTGLSATRSLLRTALVILAGCALAAADSINVSLHHDTVSQNAMAPGIEPPNAGLVVDTARHTWNAITRNGGVGLSFVDVPLALADSSPSGATVSGTAGYSTSNEIGWDGRSKDWVMMDAWYGFRAAESLTVSNLPSAITDGGYHVVIYGDSNEASRTMRYTIAGMTATLEDSGNFSGNFTEGHNLAVIADLSEPSFTISGNVSPSGRRSAINGFRIVAGDPPQPPVIDAFDADDHYVEPGTAVTLSWNVAGADTLVLTNELGFQEVTNEGGSIDLTINATTTYTLLATNADGTATAQLRIGAGPPRPNILFFLVDDMGWQDTSEPFLHDDAGNEIVTALNRRYRTPHIRTLADRGMKFTNAYAMPVCTPTRVCIMTGKNSARHHVTNWTNPSGTNTSQNSTTSHDSPADWKSGGLDPAEITLPSLLQAAGYRTITAGKAHFGATNYARAPRNCGFDVNIGGREYGHPGSYSGDYGQGGNRAVPHLEHYHNTGTHLTEALTLEMGRAIEEAAHDDVPFYAYMTHYAVHSPFQEDPRFASNYPSLSGNALNYATMIEGIDKSLGDLLAKLESLDVARDTLVVFMTDNGGDAPLGDVDNSNAPLRHKKGSKYEGGIRVPLIAAWAEPEPSNSFQQKLPIPANSREDDLVAAFDLFPTFLAAADTSFDHHIDGHDLRPYFRGEAGTHRPQQLLIHFPHDHRSDYFSIFREDDWKLIYNYASDQYELYHLTADVGESRNLAAALPDRVMAMARKMARQLDGSGAQWPTIRSTGADDPFAMPVLPAVDLDADGLPDNVEDPNRNGLVDPGETDPDLADSDRDGVSDGAERATGTDPLDPASAFHLDLDLDDTGRVQLAWPSAPGALYRIEHTSSLDSWSTLADEVPAHPANPATTYDAGLAPLDPVHFWRVVLK